MQRFPNPISNRSVTHTLNRIDPYLVLLIGLSLLALAPLTAPGYFYSAHDGRHSVFFVTMFDEAIRSGALWPRWAMHHNLGYGYPTFLIQAPLSFYLAEFFVLLGAGITAAVKLTWATAFLAGAWGMYALVKHWCSSPYDRQHDRQHDDPAALPAPTARPGGRGAVCAASACGVIAGLLYTYAPYHLVDIYVRAALAETLLMAWFPWVFLAFDRLIAYGMARGWQERLLWAAVAYAGALLTHSFALPAFTPLLMGFILFRLWLTWHTGWDHAGRGRAAFHNTLLSAGAGLAGMLLAAIFLVPLLVEGPVLVMEDWTRETYGYDRHWVHWGQFFSPFWGYGYSDDPVGANDGMGFQLGVVLLVLACLAAYALLVEWFQARRAAQTAMGAGSVAYPTGGRDNAQTQRLYLMLFFLAAVFAIAWTATPQAAGLWQMIPLLEVIQFPWRLLGLAAFTLSALGGLVVYYFGSTLRPQVQRVGGPEQAWLMDGGLLLLALAIVLASFGYSRPAALQPVEPWREDGRAVAEFEAEHPDMHGYTRYVEEPFADSPMRQQYLAALEAGQLFDSGELTRFVITSGEGEVLSSHGLGHSFGGTVEMARAGTVQIQLLAFPGWRVKLDGFVVEWRVSPPYGLMEIDLPAGFHTIEIWMGLTPPRLIGALISGGTLLLLLILRSGLWLGARSRQQTGTA